ncbi:hypothetical protein RIF29_10451 [Crotalaria pallida]|uniref:Uncharacterized protein n=1 Tax=Crotalaria pallida TaxID=3830 RepID=A0AAN9FV93_CROPI
MKTLNSHLGSSSCAAPSLSLGPAATLPPSPRESHHRHTNRCRTAEKTIAPLSAPCVVSLSYLFEPNREPCSASLALPLLANREISPSWLAPLSLSMLIFAISMHRALLTRVRTEPLFLGTLMCLPVLLRLGIRATFWIDYRSP